ncbi:hypothetical protein [Alsobacter metallidurans]|uniref:hypothetical protein n=1 Tax=Alsobacter metallidurans TaxID=340221 RepID=UPI00166419B0|nr:hypothetical protein [Alsobacter metallidurans]
MPSDAKTPKSAPAKIAKGAPAHRPGQPGAADESRTGTGAPHTPARDKEQTGDTTGRKA